MEYFYTVLYNELYSNGYDSDSLSPVIYEILMKSNDSLFFDSQQQNDFIDKTVTLINDVLDQAAPDYLYENHQFTNSLISLYYNQDNVPVENSLHPGYYDDILHYGNESHSNSTKFAETSFTESSQRSTSGVCCVSSLEDNHIDDVRIDTFRCIDLSVNAACYDPNNVSSSYSSSSVSNQSNLLSSNGSNESDNLDGNTTTINSYDIATDDEDLSCLEKEMTFAVGYLESILLQQMSTASTSNHAITVPSFSFDALEMALFLSNMDVFVAADIITSNARAISSSRPCIHARNDGKCYRRDCFFDHDFSGLPCKFWFSSIEGCVLKGCPFLHGLIVSDSQRLVDLNPEKGVSASDGISNGDIRGKDFELSEELFPALSSSGSKKTIGRPRQNSCSSWESESSLTSTGSNLSKDLDLKSCLSFTYKRNPSALSAASASTGVLTQTPSHSKKSHKVVTPSKASSGIVTAAVVKEGMTRAQEEQKDKARTASKVTQSSWVESGAGVSLMYQECREEARRLALMRNKFLEEATKAYLAGSKDLAKNLSRQGQELNKQMKVYHLEAARKIFQSRNSKQMIMRGQIDLHGLHVSEARVCMEELLPYLRANAISTVTVVTGSGHHSLGPQEGTARVLPAITQLCIDYGLKYQQVVDKNKFVGGIKISID